MNRLTNESETTEDSAAQKGGTAGPRFRVTMPAGTVFSAAPARAWIVRLLWDKQAKWSQH
jgi:hypothetical protein